MYHIAEIVRDAQRDMHERYDGHSTWAAYTPFPFLLSLGGQVSLTMQRKAPELLKRAVGRSRDCVVDTVSSAQQSVFEWRVAFTRQGQRVFYLTKSTVENVPLGPLAPLQTRLAVPAFNAVEGFAQFVTSEELPELYFVAKNSMRRRFLLRHLVLPPLGAAESVVRWAVILPSQLVFPSREEVEHRTDLFLTVSTSRVQHVVENLYSATVVLEQHWGMVQWNILGRGPYESLSPERRADVVNSILQRLRVLQSRLQRFEFMATIRLHNEMLYFDVLDTADRERVPEVDRGVPLTSEQVTSNACLMEKLDEQNESTFPCWFYMKLQGDKTSYESVRPTEESTRSKAASKAAQMVGESPPSSNNATGNGKWMEFPVHENRRLERHFRWYEKQKKAGKRPTPYRVVLVDEGRYEVSFDSMEMTPVYWPVLDRFIVCRSTWLFAKRNYGLAPYNPVAASFLEDAFTYFVAHQEEEKERLERERRQRSVFSSRVSSKCSLSVPVDGHLVEIKGGNDMMQFKKLLAGTTAFTSKRRVYRGDPRVRSDEETLRKWKDAIKVEEEVGCVPNEDDADIEEEVDELVLIVHGIGDALKTIDLINVVTLRSIIDCAANLRLLHKEALASPHFDSARASGKKLKKVEFLPVEWHSKLHMEELDKKIRDVTLPAIPKLREFNNETVLDVLFFMSPMFHQVILEQVAGEMNRIVSLFQQRNKGWLRDDDDGMLPPQKKVSILAHSLGAIISFDILELQKVHLKQKTRMSGQHFCSENESDSDDDAHVVRSNAEEFETMFTEQLKHRSESESSFVPPPTPRRGQVNATGMSVPRLRFEVDNLFCFGSPVGLFLRVRGQTLDRAFTLPNCRRLYNIYHPYDPVAYRLEPIINPARAKSKAAIIGTFEGRLRFQYQVRNSFRHFVQTLRRWRRDFEHAVESNARRVGLVEGSEHPADPYVQEPLDETGDASVELERTNSEYSTGSFRYTTSDRPVSGLDSPPMSQHGADAFAKDIRTFGNLCEGQPIDYTLQENEIEITNEYLFALTAHVIYWTNRDASLFVAQKLVLQDGVQDGGKIWSASIHGTEQEDGVSRKRC